MLRVYSTCLGGDAGKVKQRRFAELVTGSLAFARTSGDLPATSRPLAPPISVRCNSSAVAEHAFAYSRVGHRARNLGAKARARDAFVVLRMQDQAICTEPAH